MRSPALATLVRSIAVAGIATLGMVSAEPSWALRTEPRHTDVALQGGFLGPLRAIGRIETRKPLEGRMVQATGTAFFVAPCHVLTAAHVLYSKEDEARLFERDPEGGRTPLPRGELLAFVRTLQKEIDERTPRGAMRFHVLRGPDGEFDPSRALVVEHIVGVDFRADVAVLRVNRCLGVPERLGSVPLPDAEWDRADRVLETLYRHQVPLVTAGFPGDQPGDALQLNSTPHWKVAGPHVIHGASTHSGASGGPLFAFVRGDGEGRVEGAGRDDFATPEGRARLFGSYKAILVGINVARNPEIPPGNIARRLPVAPIRKAIREDLEKHRALLQPRIARESRAYAAGG